MNEQRPSAWPDHHHHERPGEAITGRTLREHLRDDHGCHFDSEYTDAIAYDYHYWHHNDPIRLA